MRKPLIYSMPGFCAPCYEGPPNTDCAPHCKHIFRHGTTLRRDENGNWRQLDVCSHCSTELEPYGASITNVSDGYHTFDELYEHRNMLFILLLEAMGGWASLKHDDDSMFEGYFIAGLHNQDISYHLPTKYWEFMKAPWIEIKDKAPKYNGYTSNDVLGNIKALLGKTRDYWKEKVAPKWYTCKSPEKCRAEETE